MSDRNEANAAVIEDFRANDGSVGGRFEGIPLLLLHTTGARSGAERVNPLVYLEDGDRLVVFATKGGAPEHPDWYFNVLANPSVRVEVGTERRTCTARVVEGDERDRLWERQKAAHPYFGDYEAKTSRTIPAIVLECVGEEYSFHGVEPSP